MATVERIPDIAIVVISPTCSRTWSVVRAQGANAARARVAIESNPWIDTPYARAWEDGWFSVPIQVTVVVVSVGRDRSDEPRGHLGANILDILPVVK